MVHLIQYLCPERHAIAATVFDDSEKDAAVASVELQDELKRLGVNPWCGICGSESLHFEQTPLPGVPSVTAAMAVMRQGEANQLITRAILEAAGQTFDARRKN